MINILHSRYPNLSIDIYQSKVQGKGAAQQLAAAVNSLNDRNDADVAIVARGGGSLEDLQAFNSEVLARAIFHSHIPIVSAVGHETDYVIADFVADLRAPTPSAAAEMVAPRKSDLQKACADLTFTLIFHLRQYIDKWRTVLSATHQRLSHPGRKVQDLQLRLDDLNQRLRYAAAQLHQTRNERFQWLSQKLVLCSPVHQIRKHEQTVKHLVHNLKLLLENYIQNKKIFTSQLRAKLTALDPTSILSRGYSIALTVPGGEIVRDPRQVDTGQRLDVIVDKGSLTCKVERKRNHVQTDL
jgi:exodeoxyribonuclease VII large subunit